MNEDGAIETCEECGKSIGYGEGVHLRLSETEDRLFCAGCANKRLARRAGLAFEHPDFVPMTLSDAEGTPRHFEFVTHIVPTGISVEAREVGKHGEGYEFQALSGFEADTMDLFRSLLERMRRELGRSHLELKDDSWRIGREGVVRARIVHDPGGEEGIPLLVIDGRPVSWHAFGRMLMTYEGWQFKLEIYDSSEEIREETIDKSRFLASRGRR